MPNTFELIASSTVGSGGAASIDFTSIPSTYTDLVLDVSLRTSQAVNANGCNLKFNGSTTSYSERALFGSGASAASLNDAGTSIFFWYIDGASSTASTFGNASMYIPNYAGSNYKSVSTDAVTENNGTTAYAFLNAGLWSNTAAINQITITAASGTLIEYSTAYLYGVKNA